jgi:hypothetical protein
MIYRKSTLNSDQLNNWENVIILNPKLVVDKSKDLNGVKEPDLNTVQQLLLSLSLDVLPLKHVAKMPLKDKMTHGIHNSLNAVTAHIRIYLKENQRLQYRILASVVLWRLLRNSNSCFWNQVYHVAWMFQASELKMENAIGHRHVLAKGVAISIAVMSWTTSCM